MKLAWESNKSSLYHGDSLELMSSLPSESIDCIWTDPPYNLSNNGTTCVAGKRVTVNKGKWDVSKGIELDHEFNLQWIKECDRILKPTGTIWVTGTIHNYPSVAFAMQKLGLKILNGITWEKPAPPPNLGCRCFTHSTELVLWAAKTNKYTFNYDQMKAENGDKQMKDVWRINTPAKSEKTHGKHPTQKAIALVDRCLRASTNPGDLVFDPFAGSSTTGVAALQLGRRFMGCEASEEFVELSIKRLSEECERQERIDKLILSF